MNNSDPGYNNQRGGRMDGGGYNPGGYNSYNGYGGYGGGNMSPPNRPNRPIRHFKYPFYYSVSLIVFLTFISLIGIPIMAFVVYRNSTEADYLRNLLITAVLAIPGAIGIILSLKRDEYSDELYEYFAELDEKSEEIENTHRNLDTMIRHAQEQAAGIENRAKMEYEKVLSDARRSGNSIVQSANIEKENMLRELKSKELMLDDKEKRLEAGEENIRKSMDDMMRKLNLFCSSVNDMTRKAVSEEYLKEFFGDDAKALFEDRAKIKTIDIYDEEPPVSVFDEVRKESGASDESPFEAANTFEASYNAPVEEFHTFSDFEPERKSFTDKVQSFGAGIFGKKEKKEKKEKEAAKHKTSQETDFKSSEAEVQDSPAYEESFDNQNMNFEGFADSKSDVKREPSPAESADDSGFDDFDDEDDNGTTLRIKIPDEYLK